MTQMKKMMVPAILAAVVAVALAAAGTASATVLCKAAESPCAEANRYPAGTQLHARMTEGELVMETAVGTRQCLNWTFTSKTSKAGSATETVEGANAVTEAAPCSIVSFLKTGGYSIHHLPGTSDGQFTMQGFEVTIEGAGIDCKFGGTFAAGTLVGGSPATLKINASVPRTGGSIFCGETMTMRSGPIEFTTPKPLYVAAS